MGVEFLGNELAKKAGAFTFLVRRCTRQHALCRTRGRLNAYQSRRGVGFSLQERLDFVHRSKGRFVPKLNQLVRPPCLIPANVTDFWCNQNVGVSPILIGDDFFHGNKDVRHHAQRCLRTFEESCVIKIYVARDNVIDVEGAHVSVTGVVIYLMLYRIYPSSAIPR